MFYKVIKNRQVIDVLDSLHYVKYQLKHKILLLCDESEAQGILSSDCNTAWHTTDLLPFPVDKYSTVTLEEIDEFEYNRLKTLNLQTPEQIAEAVLTELMERGVL